MGIKEILYMNAKEDPKYDPKPEWVEGREEAFSLIREERRKHWLKWGVADHVDGTWLKIIAEEFGELAKEMLTYQFDPEDTDANKNRITEAVQLAAVCAAYVQHLKTGSA